MKSDTRLFLEGTIIHVLKNEVEVFQYDYLSLYSIWLDKINYVPEDPDDIREPEGYSISILENELVIALLECSDQCGILGIIDTSTGKLIHAQEAAYYNACITTKDKVITLHLIHHYGIYPYFSVQIKSKGCTDFSACDEYFEVPRELGLDIYDSYSLSVDGDCLLIENSEGNVITINMQQFLKDSEEGKN